MIRESFGPRWLDDDKLTTVKATTLTSYRRAACAFINFLDERGWRPGPAEEWDDLLVEFSYEPGTTLSRLRMCHAAVEFYFPRFKGQLRWTRSRLDTLEFHHVAKHTVPAGYELCLLLASTLSGEGRARVGLGILVQYRLGLRPGELCKLTPNDVAAAPERNKQGIIIFRLGARVGTKSGREQFALLHSFDHPLLWSILRRAIALTPIHERIFPFTVATMNHWIQRAQAIQGIEVGATAHSPRAGFASDAIAEGRPAFEVKEAGRWISEASFRLYVDLIGAQTVATQLRLRNRVAAIAFVEANLDAYFPDWALACYDRAVSAGGHAEGAAPSHRGRGRPGRGRGARSQSPAGRGAGTSASGGTAASPAAAEGRGGRAGGRAPSPARRGRGRGGRGRR